MGEVRRGGRAKQASERSEATGERLLSEVMMFSYLGAMF